MTKKTTYLYLLLATLYCLLTLLKPYPFAWLVKILPMLVLLYTVSLEVIVKSTLPKIANNQTSNQNGKTVTMLLMALLCSTCGDILLAMQGEHFFISGLTSFLIAHLFFLISFKPLIKQNLIYIPIYAGVAVAVFSLMANKLNELFIPVFVYILVLLAMAVGTLLSSKSNKWMVIGGVFFVVSDSLIGLTKFYIEIPQSQLWIMITYYAAQYCLVNGLLAASTRVASYEGGE
ncbi:lysoplasmalogenase [Psychrosphaera saromensis]|uniref:Lysoplasmalogenase n=1 Tax=Psychrosphaera saromensis TaxID=716813 RepID=A0A2S7UXM4_9GAMM|nr:lysoplasmalogenase [Psychrosphaera saromensis]PQJ54737.1 hypothetical protein BTO11_14480 [Psychrosphaera saromensis]